MKAPPSLRRNKLDESSGGLGFRIALFVLRGGIGSDFIYMLRNHRIGWIEIKSLDEVRARFIGVAERPRLVRCLHQCGGAMLARYLIRRMVLLVAGDE